MIVIIFFLFIFVLLYFHLTRNFNYWRNKEIPYDAPKFLVGSALPLIVQKQSMGEYLWGLYNKSSFSCYGFYVFDQPFLLAKDAALVKMILTKDFEYFDDRTFANNINNDKLSGLSLLLLKNPLWKSYRPRFTSTLSLAKVKAMLPLLTDAAEDFAQYLENVCSKSDIIECRHLSIKYSVDVFAACAFGIKSKSFENSDFFKMAGNLQNSSSSRVIQSVSYYFAPMLLKLMKGTFLEPKSVEFIKQVFLNNIKLRRKENVTKGDLIDLLLEMDEKLDDFSIEENGLAISLEYLIAGYMSCATILSFLLYELCLNESMQKRIRSEVESALCGKKTISYSSVHKMTYLDMAVKETLRKYPILPFLDRRCKKPYSIPNTDIIIDKDIPVFISLLGLHYDPKYFPEPHKFDPERFSPDSKNEIKDCVYLPFGEGRRNCPGSVLGSLTVKIAVIKLLQHFEITRSEVTPPTIDYEHAGFILTPRNEEINVQFKKLPTTEVLHH
ncbi:hypothetical protein FQA39_LY08669 [Lamprigera yunnana]|nr:hypothetical protein FQA39_LY08669 [Lamprigera yunnana]